MNLTTCHCKLLINLKKWTVQFACFCWLLEEFLVLRLVHDIYVNFLHPFESTLRIGLRLAWRLDPLRSQSQSNDTHTHRHIHANPNQVDDTKMCKAVQVRGFNKTEMCQQNDITISESWGDEGPVSCASKHPDFYPASARKDGLTLSPALAKRKRRSIQDYLRLKISTISLEINSSAKRIKELTKRHWRESKSRFWARWAAVSAGGQFHFGWLPGASDILVLQCSASFNMQLYASVFCICMQFVSYWSSLHSLIFLLRISLLYGMCVYIYIYLVHTSFHITELFIGPLGALLPRSAKLREPVVCLNLDHPWPSLTILDLASVELQRPTHQANVQGFTGSLNVNDSDGLAANAQLS